MRIVKTSFLVQGMTIMEKFSIDASRLKVLKKDIHNTSYKLIRISLHEKKMKAAGIRSGP
jgi:hypothetical protein